MDTLSLAAYGLIAVAIAAKIVGRLTTRQSHGLFAIVFALLMIDDIRNGATGWAMFGAALFAWAAFSWWRGGGGGGMRRRLRSRRRKFRGVRRTAPQST